MIGGNKSAEDDGQEDSEQQGTTGINVVLANKLWEQEGFKKKDYKKHIKEYIKRIVAHLQEKKPDEVDKFKADASKAVVSILSKYDDLQLFRGESLDPDVDEGECMLVLVEYRDSKPFLLFFKHGLEEEKMVNLCFCGWRLIFMYFIVEFHKYPYSSRKVLLICTTPPPRKFQFSFILCF